MSTDEPCVQNRGLWAHPGLSLTHKHLTRPRTLQITAENDEVANGLLERFTGFFRDMHEGRRAAPLTKLIVANVLIDEEPTMVDEYLELFDKCCNTFAWAGKLSPPPEDLAMITPSAGTGLDAQPSAAGLPSQLQPSASGIEDISTAAEAQEVGTVSGSTSARRGNRTGSSRPTHGKREWLAMAKRLVPEGRGSYALWFTSCNIAIIISVFAYMAGDYAMWVKENRGSFLADESIPANTDTYAEVRPPPLPYSLSPHTLALLASVGLLPAGPTCATAQRSSHIPTPCIHISSVPIACLQLHTTRMAQPQPHARILEAFWPASRT